MEISSSLAQLQRLPADAQEAFQQAQQLFRFAQFEAVLAIVSQLPESSDVASLRRESYMQLSQWAFEVGDLARAEWACAQCLREENRFEAWMIRGEIASGRGDDLSSLEYFDRALKLLPHDHAATVDQIQDINRLLYLRVAALVRLQRYSEAIEHWRAAIARDESNSDLWYIGALCLTQMGRANEALPVCQRAVLLDPRHIDANKLRRTLQASSSGSNRK
jgi:tetratricopeptide (TPR) repeat protein